MRKLSRQNIMNFLRSLHKRTILIIIVVLLGATTIFATLYPFEGVGEWTGIGKDSNKSVTTEQEINPKTKKVTKITKKETENFQSAKTLWDWLGLLGTIAIPFVLFSFERTEQRRSEKEAETEKKIADNNLREQALEAYLDRMSELLIDKRLKVLISKNMHKSDPKYQMLDALLDVARARTLSVLRRLDQDGERKGSVIRFLVDAELISNLDLNTADLSNADLSGVNLTRAKLSKANLSGADLGNAVLIGANLIGANLSRSVLIGANLSEADLTRANLTEANLIFYANLSGADLTEANLSGANLTEANLSGANLSGANLSGANLTVTDLKDANLGATDLSRAKFLTPEQVKQANYWEIAKYKEEFRAQLGLPAKPDK